MLWSNTRGAWEGGREGFGKGKKGRVEELKKGILLYIQHTIRHIKIWLNVLCFSPSIYIYYSFINAMDLSNKQPWHTDLSIKQPWLSFLNTSTIITELYIYQDEHILKNVMKITMDYCSTSYSSWSETDANLIYVTSNNTIYTLDHGPW